MKRFLSAFLALALIVSVVAVCGGRASAAKALPEGVLYRWGFENDSDLAAAEQIERKAGAAAASTYDVVPVNRKPDLALDQGVYGSALHLDGTYGVRLNDLEKIDLEAYSISFWVCAAEFPLFAPIIQLGSNLGRDPQLGASKWLSIYLSPENGTNISHPTVETYDSSKGAVEFPGIASMLLAEENSDTAVNEWKMITLVVDGKTYTADDGDVHVGTKVYVNGKLSVEANEEKNGIYGVLPGVLSGENFEGFIGINYQNNLFHGYVDEVYFFDRALSEESIQKVLAEGDPSRVPVEAVKVAPPEITKNPTAETVNEGGSAYYVARATNYNYMNWYVVSADRSTRIPVNNAPWSFPGLTVSGEGTTTLLLSNIPMAMNGWCVEAVFTGDGGSAVSDHCFIYVKRAPRLQLVASPSSGYYTDHDQPVTLTAAPGDTIHYELYTGYQTFTGTVRSGEKIYVPILGGLCYDAQLYAYVVGDTGNAVTCRYTMDDAPAPQPTPAPKPTPGFSGGYFTNGEAEVTLIPTGGDSFSANVSIIRLCNMDGYGTYSNGVVYITITDSPESNIHAEFNVNNGTLFISSSSWEYLPTGTSFSGLN